MATNKYNVEVSTGKELYPTDAVTQKQTVLENRYAKDENQLPYYPRDEHGNEFMDSNLGLIERNGRVAYPIKFADGKPNYLTDPAVPAKQIYVQHKGKWIIGTGADGHQYYAVDENENEYYPEDNTVAVKANGTKFYARKKPAAAGGVGETVFPQDADTNEYYVTSVDVSKDYTIPTRYAKDVDGNELYPERSVIGNLKSQTIILDTYAKKSNNAFYYPKDAYNNEFYISNTTVAGAARTAAQIVLQEYAVTNDGKVILPTLANTTTFHIVAGKTPDVTADNVLGRLIREGTIVSSDWLTDVEVSVKPTVEPKAYMYRDKLTGVHKTVTPPGTKPAAAPAAAATASSGGTATASSGGTTFYKAWYFWIVLFISLIVKGFGIWWFVFRNKNTYRVT